MVIGKLNVLLGLNSTQFNTGMAAAGSQVRALQSTVGAATTTVSTFSTAITRLSIAATGMYAAIQIVQPLRDFNQAMATSTAIMGDLSSEMRLKMEATAKDVAVATKFSAAETAGAYYELASAGLTAEQAMAALPQVAMFAQAGMFDLATATRLATTAQNALGMTVANPVENLKNLTRITDVLTEANNMASGTVEDFANALTTKAGAAARSVGMDLEEVVAVLAAMAKQGTLGEEAGTQFGMVLRDLQTKAIENAKAFAQNNVAVFDATGDMRNMADIIGDIEMRLSGMSDEMKKATLMSMGFSDRSLHTLMTLLGTSKAIREYEQRLRGASGATQEVAEKNLPQFEKSLHASWEMLKRLSMLLAEPIMAAFTNEIYVLTKIAEPLLKGLEKLRAFIVDVAEANQEFFGGMAKTAPAVVETGNSVAKAGSQFNAMADGASSAKNNINDAAGATDKLKKKVDDFIATTEGKVQYVALGSLGAKLAQLAMQGAFDLPGGIVDYEKFNRARNAVIAANEMEREKKTIEKRKRELEKLAEAGTKLTESVMTPMEQFNKRQADANRLLQVGAISWGTYRREIAAAREELLKLQKVEKGPGLVERGSQEDYAARTAWQMRTEALVRGQGGEVPEVIKLLGEIKTVLVAVDDSGKSTSAATKRTATAVERNEPPEVVDM